MASTEFQGRDVEDINSELEHILQRIYGGSPGFDLGSLCIVEGAQCWVIYVDVLVLETGGNVLDHISIAVKAALWDTRIPKVTVLPAGEQEQTRGGPELEVSDDPFDSQPLVPTSAADTVPICITLGRVGSKTIADASPEEEAVMSAQLSLGVSPAGNPCGVQKRGQGALEPAVRTPHDTTWVLLLTLTAAGVGDGGDDGARDSDRAEDPHAARRLASA